jgi:hypothetical protein
MRVVIVKGDARAREKPCLGCGLSLRKHLDARHCPQCGLSVWLSLNQNDALDYSKPGWLRRLSSAFWLMAATQWMPVVSLILILLPRGESTPRRYALAALFAGLYLLIHHGFLLLATWPERRYPDKLAGYKIAIQVIAGISILFGAALTVRAVTRLNTGWPVQLTPLEQLLRMSTTRPTQAQLEAIRALEMEDEPPDQSDWWRDGAVALLAASALATFAYLRKLAHRAGHPKVAWLCGWILLAPVLPLLKAFPFRGLYILIHLSANLPLAAALVYYPLSLGVFAWFALTTNRAAAAAAENWAKESVAATHPPPAASK